MGCSMPRTSALACSVQTMRLAIALRCFFRQRLLPHLFPIGHGQSELRQDFLMRDRLVVLEPLIGLGDGLALRIAQSISILIGSHHGFQQMNHSGELAGAELVEQVMSVLYVSGHCVLP